MPDKYYDTMLILCDKLDKLYNYTKNLIPKTVTHSLGFKKEQYKELIQKTILALKKAEKKKVLQILNNVLERIEFHTENPDSELMDDVSEIYKKTEGGKNEY